MAITAELSKDEQDLFDAMAKGDGAAPAANEPQKDAPKQEAKAEPKQDAKAEEKAAPKAEEKQERKVIPAEALHEARQANKALKEELAQMKKLVSDGDAKLQKFMETVQKRAEAPAAPKFEDDPAGALKAKNDQLEKDLAEVKDRLARQDQANEQGNRLNQHAATVKAAETAFAKENPDYWKASDFVAEVWRDEFREAGFDDDKIPQMVFQKALVTTGQAVAKGKDPAASIWAIAKRYGFSAAAKDAPKEEAKGEAKAGGESKLQQIEKGLEAAKTAGGAKGPDDLTLASLADMTDDQIEKLVADPDWWSKSIRRSPLH